MARVLQWTAPTPAKITAVSAGQVVSVCIRAQTGSTALQPEITGVMPHVVYTATVPPDGTSALYEHDPVSGAVYGQVGDRPYAKSLGQIGAEQIQFLVDLGKPFLCPWEGNLSIEGGRSADGQPTTYDLSIVSTMPHLNGIHRALHLPNGTQAHNALYFPVGAVPRTNPTISYQNVPETLPGIQLPRGVYAVQASDDTSVAFTVFGVTTTVRIKAGASIAIGPFNQGSFAAAAGLTIPAISFDVEIA